MRSTALFSPSSGATSPALILHLRTAAFATLRITRRAFIRRGALDFVRHCEQRCAASAGPGARSFTRKPNESIFPRGTRRLGWVRRLFVHPSKHGGGG